MNRRGFISMLGGAAGAAIIPWRLDIQPIISLPKPPSEWYSVGLRDVGRELVIDSSEYLGITMPREIPIGSIITVVNKGPRKLLIDNQVVIAGTQEWRNEIDKSSIGTMFKIANDQKQWVLAGTGLS